MNKQSSPESIPDSPASDIEPESPASLALNTNTSSPDNQPQQPSNGTFSISDKKQPQSTNPPDPVHKPEQKIYYSPVFITGGSGYLGRNLISYLTSKGISVVAIARSKKSLEIVSKRGAIGVECDINDTVSMQNAIIKHKCQVCVHCAGYVKMWGLIDDALKINTQGTVNVYNACKRSGNNIKRLIHISTEQVLLTKDNNSNSNSNSNSNRDNSNCDMMLRKVKSTESFMDSNNDSDRDENKNNHNEHVSPKSSMNSSSDQSDGRTDGKTVTVTLMSHGQLQPLGIYSASKQQAELELFKLIRNGSSGGDGSGDNVDGNSHSFETVIVRPPIIWGNDDTTFLPNLIRKIENGSFIWIDNGMYKRSMVNINNLCDAIYQIIGYNGNNNLNGKIYFVKDEKDYIFKYFIKDMLKCIGNNKLNKKIVKLDKSIKYNYLWCITGCLETLFCCGQSNCCNCFCDCLFGCCYYNCSGCGNCNCTCCQTDHCCVDCCIPPVNRVELAVAGREWVENDENIRNDIGYKSIYSNKQALIQFAKYNANLTQKQIDSLQWESV